MKTQAKIEDNRCLNCNRMFRNSNRHPNSGLCHSCYITFRTNFGHKNFKQIAIAIKKKELLGITEGKKLMIDEVLKWIDKLSFSDYMDEIGFNRKKFLQKLNKLKEQDEKQNSIQVYPK